ncbi:MAG: phosphomannomutase/phosphoglucomutase [Planctomycetota bacterium]
MIGKVFKAYDVRALYPDPLDESVGWKVGLATGRFLKEQNGPGKVVVSRDHRPAAPGMAKALIDGLRAAGMSVVDLGRCDTSIQYFAIPHLDAVGGVQCTASHNPIDYIGYKISREQAKPVGADTGLKDIEAIAQSLEGDCPPPASESSYEEADIWPAYREHILGFMGELKRPLKLFVDASNGCGIALLDRVFSNVPNLEIITANDEWTDDWAHEPNPLVAENMVPTQDGVQKHSADLGACFDGDADRCMLVDDTSELCGCDHLTAWLAHHFVAVNRTDPAAEKPTSIVYDLRSSKVVPETIEALGAKPAVSKVGHVNIKAKLRETAGVFGGELSGHFYFRGNSYADSGAITLATALGVLSQSDDNLSDQIAPFRKYPQSGEINFENEDKQGTMDALKTKYGPDGEVMELDGVTIDCWDSKGWWCNVRASNTEPLLRLNAEAKDEKTLAELLAEIKPKLGVVAEGH